MRENIARGLGLHASSRVLVALVDDGGMSREDAYAIVQRAALRAADERAPLRDLLAVDPAVAQRLSLARLDACFDEAGFLHHVPEVIARLDCARRRARGQGRIRRPGSPMLLGEGRGYLRSGKVRDLYELPDRRLVLVASDRISAFDVVLPSMIPDKGRVLTGLSRFWFGETAGIVPNHLLDSDVGVIEDAIARSVEVTGSSSLDLGSRDELRGRVMVCRPTTVFPIEAVVRGYLAGSGWKEYQADGTVCGVALRPGLRESDRLPEPIFTPATKADAGEHDQNISFDGMVRRLKGPRGRVDGGEIGEAIREHALRLYRYAASVLEVQGILLADTKFEFGLAWNDGAGEVVGPPGERIVERDPARAHPQRATNGRSNPSSCSSTKL